MINRCYSEKQQKISVTYINCSVDERWHNFQVFSEWFENNYIEDYHLDKDILFKGNKIYGPDTCCFVPQEINNLFVKSYKIRGKYPIGVSINNDEIISQIYVGYKKYLGSFKTVEEAFDAYKIEKENYIKEIANKWKSKISENVYNALINYQVEIND